MNKASLLFIIVLLHCCTCTARSYIVFIGSYNEYKTKEGIYVYQLDTVTGGLKKITSVRNLFHPSYLTLSPDGGYVYACTESLTPNAGSVSGLAYEPKNGTLTYINSQKSGGENPVYLAVDKSGKWLVNGNYTEGSVSVYPLDANGRIQPASQIISFSEGSINKERQERAHIHATIFSPSQDYLFLPDLGADKIRCFAFDADNAQPLQSATYPYTAAMPGCGPRHMAFHPNGIYAYCIEELSGTISAYSYVAGKLERFQHIDAHPQKIKDEYSGADIHTSPDGLFLYASNRGNENNIAIFSIDAHNGHLSLIGYQSTLGDHPRNFVIDPSGKFLLVANQISGNVVVFRRNSTTGKLQKTKAQIKIPGASCLQIRRYN